MLTVSPAWAALVLAGILIHLFADWFLQNDWMAKNKTKKGLRNGKPLWEFPSWLDRHPAAFIHASIHAVLLLLVFPLWAALLIGVLHLIIDTRSPLEWWGKFTRQTRQTEQKTTAFGGILVDLGMMVAFWRDQTSHFIVIALVALGC